MKLTTKIMLMLAAFGICLFLLMIAGNAFVEGAKFRAFIALFCVACDCVVVYSIARAK